MRNLDFLASEFQKDPYNKIHVNMWKSIIFTTLGMSLGPMCNQLLSNYYQTQIADAVIDNKYNIRSSSAFKVMFTFKLILCKRVVGI